ncbi:MAG: amidohydrolase family protein [Chloroflexi bacterium]|nr:amidohydrolase family protein [Chloroflexota bacterium]
MDLLIKNARIVSPAGITPGAIGIDQGKIVAIAAKETALPPAARTIDAAGQHVLPGVCDLHCHPDYLPSPPFAPWDLISRTESAAAALGGVTTMGFYMKPPAEKTIAESFGGLKSDWETNAIVDCVFHMSIASQLRKDEMLSVAAKYGITTFKFPIGYKGPEAAGVGGSGIDDGFVFDGFERVAQLKAEGWPAMGMIHAENPDIIPYLRRKVEHRNDVRAWHDSRPNFVEAECMNRFVFLADVAGCPLYIVHVTIKEGVDIVARARYEGKNVIGETCPQFLTHNHDNLPKFMREKPVLVVTNPPIRAREDNERLWDGIRDGVVSVVGSDTAPNTVALKGEEIWQKGFMAVGLGATSGQILPVLLSEGVNRRGLSLEKVVEVTSYNPARIFGIYPQKGNIGIGADADLVIVDLNKEVDWSAALSPSNTGWSIYEGWQFKGWPVLTMVRGKIVAEDGKVVEAGGGRYLPRKRVSQ